MEERSRQELEARIRDRICPVCVDRNMDGSCNRLAQNTCTLMAKLPLAAEAVVMVTSDRIDPYVQAIRDNVCAVCDGRYPDGTCAPRDTDNCMLSSYLPLVVEAIEAHFGREFPLLPAALAHY